MGPGDDAHPRAAAVRTFLIADIRGYTRFTAEHDDEAASRLARGFAEIVAEGVEAWGGELVELRGTAGAVAVAAAAPGAAGGVNGQVELDGRRLPLERPARST